MKNLRYVTKGGGKFWTSPICGKIFRFLEFLNFFNVPKTHFFMFCWYFGHFLFFWSKGGAKKFRCVAKGGGHKFRCVIKGGQTFLDHPLYRIPRAN